MASGRLTEDEKAFLRDTGAYRKELRSRSESSAPERTLKKPRLPVKTMIAVVIIGVVLTLAVSNVMASVQPYATLASSSAFQSVSSNSDGLGDTPVSSISEMSTIYGYRSWAYVAVVVVIAVIEALLALQWLLRYNAWERKIANVNRRKHEKKSDSSRNGHRRSNHRVGDRRTGHTSDVVIKQRRR